MVFFLVNKAEGLKTVVSRKQSTPNSQNRHFKPPDTYTQVGYQGVRNVCYWENLERFFFLLTAFVICPFTLSPIFYSTKLILNIFSKG